MTTIFDFLSVSLFIAAAGLFFSRFRKEDPPLTPYVVVSLACAIGNWLGNNGNALLAVALFAAAAFLTLHLASEPFREDTREPR
ncbi:MAG: hypothetical protein HKN14_06535 [Marinicaulis sp.]|nr:hypothetical protein [Marinicaulis sp.]NNE40559.1 hypothetical protein [Marinicaulis sp.]NNL90112.1 hypothetical protein [Marinicaulis sp.]